MISVKKEPKDIKEITNLGDITEAYKRAIKLVPVNWQDRELEIPIYYSMDAASTYEKAFEETKNYRKAFCKMVLRIIRNSRNVVYQEDEFPTLQLDDIESLSDNDLKKIGEEIIDSSDYLKRFDEEVTEEADDFFIKFYLIHKKEAEEYREQMKKIAVQMKSKLDFLDNYKNLLPSIELASRISRITETVRLPLVDTAMYQNIINNPALMELAATASKMGSTIDAYMKVINPMHNNISNVLKMQSAIASSSAIIAAVQNFYSEINAIRDILQPNNMEYIRRALESQESLRRALNNNLQSHIQILGAELNNILNFTYNDKLFNFVNVQQSIINNIKPFLLNIQTVLISRANIKESLKKKAKTMLQFGWWFIGSLPIEKINYIHRNRETLLQEDVDKMICDYYKASDYKELEGIIREWDELEYFCKWGSKIDDAFYAHKSGKYSLSVPVWAFMLEGIIRDFLRDAYGISEKRFSFLYNNFKEKAKELDNFIVNYAFNCIDSFYVRFNPEEPDEVQDFSRHKIFHGQALNYDNEINSLKLILYLDELFYMISSLKSLNIA
jgi:vacuolar-type H+-ATPase subunit E/Vma4